jgi:hypothetical protein
VVRALAALALLAASSAAAAERPLCRAEVSVEPARAFVGEPVLHRVRIAERPEVIDMRWVTSLSFPAFRAERILGPEGPRAAGAETKTIEERRVLFPARAGRLALPPARIACESAGRVETADVPGSEVVAEEPPAEGRPPGWAGLIGPVELSVQATPDRVALGESVALAVTVQGGTNVWAAPVAFGFPPDVAEVFERPSELSRDMGRSLGLRWYRTFDVVPRRAGVLDVPELRVAWFDPRARRWDETRAPALHIEVIERAAASPAPAPDTAPAAPAPGARRGPLVFAAAALALGAAAGVGVGIRLRRRRRGPAPPLPVATNDERAEVRAALGRALAQDDGPGAAAAAARLLRLALEPALPGARSLAAEELAASAPGELAERLARLEQARYRGAADAELLALAREAGATESHRPDR